MRRAPRTTFHSYYLFPTIILLFIAQPVAASLASTESDFLVPPLALTLVAALWSLERGGPWFRVALGLGLGVLGLFVVGQFGVGRPALFATAGLLVTLSALCSVRGIRWLLLSREVTIESLLTAMSVYLLIGISFGMLAVLFYFADPGTYHGVAPGGRSSEVAELMYFSLGTLTTAAYGDITPLHPVTRVLSNLEAAVGQMYLAVLVATIVSGWATTRRR